MRGANILALIPILEGANWVYHCQLWGFRDAIYHIGKLCFKVAENIYHGWMLNFVSLLCILWIKCFFLLFLLSQFTCFLTWKQYNICGVNLPGEWYFPLLNLACLSSVESVVIRNIGWKFLFRYECCQPLLSVLRSSLQFPRGVWGGRRCYTFNFFSN